MHFTALELCAGGGGQALGLEMAGFEHAAAVEYEPQFCQTLRINRSSWNVLEQDVRDLNPRDFSGVDLVSAGVPCPPFSVAGKQLGADDDRDMFPSVLNLIQRAKPRGVIFENVQGLASAKFASYRANLMGQLMRLGYEPEWRLLQASSFGVSQLRPRFVLVALRRQDAEFFRWPAPQPPPATVGERLMDLMAANGWKGAPTWTLRANAIAPTIVGGSKKHGGPDLGPTRAKAQWRLLGVDGMGIRDAAPDHTFPLDGVPRLTVRMVARLQGFPDSWVFSGKKTVAYRQVGNAFPPPVARAVGRSIQAAFQHKFGEDDCAHAHEVEMRLLEDPPKARGRSRAKLASNP